MVISQRRRATPRPQTASRSRESVQSVSRVVAILDVLGRAAGPLNARELSAQVGLPRPTVYRLLQTLTDHGMAVLTDGGFAIGPRVLWLAAQRLEQIELRAVGRPVLLELRDRTRETAHMAVLEQGQVVYIDKVESGGPLRMASAIGKIMPAHSTALGKSMLAHLPKDAVRRILEANGMPRRTPNTITDLRSFFQELAAIRGRGYAIDNVENEDGIRCVGAPIFDHRGQVAGAISLSGSMRGMTLKRIRRFFGPQIREAARLISTGLGWAEPLASGDGERG